LKLKPLNIRWCKKMNHKSSFLLYFDVYIKRNTKSINLSFFDSFEPKNKKVSEK
jgi:hypothetical protein